VYTRITSWPCGVDFAKTDSYQSVRGQDILVEVTLHVSKALQGHLMYFFPSGGGLIG
jgi:hypothetical protein